MADSISRFNGWPGADDRLDPMLAMGTSVTLHLLPLLLLLFGGLGSGSSARSSFQGISDAPASTLEASEFRQRLVLIPLTRLSKKIPTPTAIQVEPLPDDSSPPLAPVSERPLDAQSEVSDQQARTANSYKGQPPPDASQSTKEANSPIGSQALKTGTNSASGGSSDQLRAAYLAALRNTIQGKWSISPSHHGNCSVTVRQMIGGNVASAIASDCDLDKADRMALEAAALMAQPLPYAGFESVFSEEVTLKMSN